MTDYTAHCILFAVLNDGNITVIDVQVAGCTGDRCVVKKGTNMSLTISFTSSECHTKS